ncbi:MAG: FecR domain-containing protein [Bacteroidota bacterium]
MNRDHYITLIYKQLKGEISLEEQAALDQWLSQEEEHAQLAKKMENDWANSANYEASLDLDMEAEFERLQQRLRAEAQAAPKEAVIRELRPKRRNRRSWLGWAAAAVLLLAAGSTWWFSQPAELEWMVLATGADEQQEVQLVDGSTVVLNANSQLEYPKDFSATQRLVRLTGEAFFDIEHNPEAPFVIESEQSEVTVLGTSFNVRAYAEEDFTEVAVRTGKVRLRARANNQRIQLTANQTGTLNNKTNALNKVNTPNSNALSWQTGQMRFVDQPVEKVIGDLQRVFSFDVSLENEALRNCGFNGVYPSANYRDILNDVANNFNATLMEDGEGRLILNGGQCD